jgi:DNA-binding NtrC family response regulator
LAHFGGGELGWLTPKVLHALETRPWRGNVRELRNFVERARAIGPTGAMNLLQDAPEEREPVTAVLARVPESAPLPASVPVAPASVPPYGGPDAPSFMQPFRTFREQWIGHGEKAFLRALLEVHQNNVAAAAKEAGIDRTHMYRLIRKHGL